MATTPQPVPNGGGAPDAGATPSPASPPSQGQPSQTQIKLAMLYQACKRLAEEDPQVAAGLAKAAQIINETQSSLATQPQPQPTGSNPPY